jgi:hypothetical protein
MATLQVTEIQEKQPWEKILYTLPFIKTIPTDDVISSVAFAVFNETDDPDFATDLSGTMIWEEDFDTDTSEVNCGVAAGTDGKTYRLRVRVVCTSAARFENDYRFLVREV